MSPRRKSSRHGFPHKTTHERSPSAEQSSTTERFPLLSLPPEVATRVSEFWRDHRLGLPTSTLNSNLARAFRNPSSIAARAVRHFCGSVRALRNECRRGDVPVVRALLRIGAVPDRIALLTAVATGHCQLTVCLLDSGAPDIEKALPEAAARGHCAVVKLLLLRPRDNFNLAACQHEAIRRATEGLHLDVVKVLVAHGAQASDKALITACQLGSGDILRELLPTVTKLSSVFLNRLLFECATGRGGRGRGSVVKLLIERGAQVNGHMGKAALLAACRSSDVEVVAALLEGGAKENDEALRESIMRGDHQIERLLTLGTSCQQLGFAF